MPNSPSAKKRLRQNDSRRIHSRAIKSSVRTQLRRVHAAIEEGDVEASKTEFRVATKMLDQAAAKKVIHANKAARTKSRVSKVIKKLQQSGSA